MVTPTILGKIYEMIEKRLRAADIIAGKSGRHMKFPYTFSAKIAQFPLFYYMRNNWIWMYYPLGLLAGFYAFSKVHGVVNSEESKRSWAENQRKNAEKEAEAHDH